MLVIPSTFITVHPRFDPEDPPEINPEVDVSCHGAGYAFSQNDEIDATIRNPKDLSLLQ
jgi:hypothetical protein